MEEHEQSDWCWCRPKIENVGILMIVHHRDIDPATITTRKFAGGVEYASDGDAAHWRHLIP